MMASTQRPEAHAAPVDLALMRQTVDRLLAPDALSQASSLDADEVSLLTLQLRGHLELIIPEVESAARRLHRDSIPRYCSLACVGEARGKLASEPCRRYGGDIGHARRLARVLRSLCEHHTELQQAAS